MRAAQSSASETETRFVRTWSHAEDLRLAAAAKLPPLLICLRETRQSHGDREKTERQKGWVREGERARIRKMDLDAGEG